MSRSRDDSEEEQKLLKVDIPHLVSSLPLTPMGVGQSSPTGGRLLV